MKISSETLPERQVRLQIEVDAERHAQAIEAAYKRLAPRVQIRGFRPGKAPRPLIEKQLGRHRLLDEAMDIILPQVYREALEQESITPVAQPTVELVSHEPLIFTATVPLEPVVDLRDYKAVRVPREKPTVTDEQVEEYLTQLRRRYGTVEPVDRPAQKGDIVRGDVSVEVDGQMLFKQEEIEFRLTEEALASLPGLLDVVVGLTKGDELEQKVQAPADFADARFAGKEVTYRVRVAEVKEEKLAEPNDDFARTVGEGFESIQALRDRIRRDLQQAADEAERARYELQALDALVEQASIEYPQVLVEHEIDHILEDQANLDPRDPRAQELYLSRLGKTEAEVRESVRGEAEQRLRRALVLGRFAELEGITVEDAEIDAEIERMAAAAGQDADALRKVIDTEGGRESIRRSLRTRKTLDRLIAIASGEFDAAAGAESPQPEATAEPTEAPAQQTTPDAEGQSESAPKRRRSAPRALESPEGETSE